MIRFSVCIEPLWKEKSVEEKIKGVKKAGFAAFEFWGWKNKNIEGILKVKEETGLETSAFCFEPNFCLTADGNEAELLKGIAESAKTAHLLKCRNLIVTTGDVVADESFEVTRRKVVRKLKQMTKAAEDNNVTLVLEPLNPVINHKGYWLTRSADAVDIVTEIGSPNLKILFDIYHQQVTEGNILHNIGRYISFIGHFHSAGVPGRNELEGGELNYGNIFTAIDKMGYKGFIGLEFMPKTNEETALKQVLSLGK